MEKMIQEVTLEEIVENLFDKGSFSRNGTTLVLNDYTAGRIMDQNGIYVLARDIEDKREKLNIALFPSRSINPVRLYRSIPKNHELKKNTVIPFMPHESYFTMVDLIETDFERYKGDEGYIQLARDMKEKRGRAPHLGHLFSGAIKYRGQLGWSGEINISLDAFDAIEELIAGDFEKYRGDEGYIQLARDLRDKRGKPTHLGHIWSGAKKHREKLEWSGHIHLSLYVFDTIEDLIEQDFEKYTGDEGYIQLARDLRTRTGTAAHLGHVWSGSKKYRDDLGWTGMIQLPLDVFDAIERLIEQDFEKYKGQEGYIRLAGDLRNETGRGVHPSHIWSGTRKYRDELGWKSRIASSLDALDRREILVA